MSDSSQFFIGCAVWAYQDWVGEFYPVGSRPTDFLKIYSQRLTAVEGNTTFYSIPNLATINRWVEQTPPGFKFCLKLPKAITHTGLLAPNIPQALSFLAQMQPLGERLGPMFAQLPPQYAPVNLMDLQMFLEAWPHNQAALALEVRHLSWFQEPYSSQLNKLLEQFSVGRVLLDSRPIYLDPATEILINLDRKKPNLPVPFCLTAPFTLIRFISHPDAAINQIFWQEWSLKISQWLSRGIQIYFFVHCPLEERSPANVRHFQHELAAQKVPVPPLPWDQIKPEPIQLSLWE
ncbi:MAG: DUF72 domain-containing protein [Oscillatoriales cyanobacterium RM2_1_1]|nr:DUF72 domain-containing protein [Oscillatoriales cyanobacterium SM2_3_0]NJO47266.1 DUF72 domain-containing protein [Oscillatoriales cyanobacterium RM2_1_1]